MLRKRNPTDEVHDPDVIRDLGIVALGVDLGTIVRPSEPNYALISSATSTIRKVLTGLQSRDKEASPAVGASTPHSLSQFDSWVPGTQLEPWGVEFSFWQNLAEHPSIFDPACVE
jgi:hypothetical protein